MAAKITKFSTVNNAKTVFDDLKKVYYCTAEIDSVADFQTVANAELELKQLPITEDGVTLNMGGVNTTFKKLNTGEIWGSKVDRDDPEVSFNVANIAAWINSLFMGDVSFKADNTEYDEAKIKIAGDDVYARGYALELNAVKGSLWFPAENGEGWIVLPKIKMYGGLNGTDDSNTAYYACQVTPEQNGEGASLYIITKNSTAGSNKTYSGYAADKVAAGS